MIYMDNGATMPLCTEALEEMNLIYKTLYANPSASYRFAREAAGIINSAKESIARIIGAEDEEIIFTSGGSESNTFALRGVGAGCSCSSEKKIHMVISSIEHSSVLQTAKFLERQGVSISYVQADSEGIISPERVERLICKDTVLISVMTANNEIGTLEPIEEIGKIAKERNIFFHTDAVSAMGYVEICVKNRNIDLLSASAHKFGGPKGAGFLYCKKDVPLKPLVFGGMQEYGLRGGTENTAGIAGMKKALEVSMGDFSKKEKELLLKRDMLTTLLTERIPEAVINGHRTKRLPGNVHFSIPGVSGERLLMYMDMDGICASSGSACMSRKHEPSHVLKAIGMAEDLAEGSIRLTISEKTTLGEIRETIESICRHKEECRRY